MSENSKALMKLAWNLLKWFY